MLKRSLYLHTFRIYFMCMCIVVDTYMVIGNGTSKVIIYSL